MEDLVSIIIPIYNAEKYLNRCLDSILIQTYFNIEIILINDGSIDNSLEICKSFSKVDDRIVLISQNNKGVSAARNKGMEIAQGKYVCFVDADDYISDDYIFFLYNKIIQFDADMASCSLSIERKKDDWGLSSSNKEKCFDRTDGLISLFKQNGINSSPCCKLYKRSILKEHHICFDESIKMAEDKLFCYNYSCYCNRIYFSSEIKYFYVYNSSSASNKKYVPKGLNDPNLGFLALNAISKLVMSESEQVVKYYLTYTARAYIRMVYRWNLFLYLSKEEVNFIRAHVKYCYRNGYKEELLKSKQNYLAGMVIIISKQLTITLSYLLGRFYKKQI